MCHVRGAFTIGYLRRRSLTLSCINLGMSHKMLFYMRWMIYIDIECLQFCEGRAEFAFFMATVLNAKDVCPSWQKMKNPSLKTCCTNQVRDGYIHFDVVLCQVLKWRFEIAHKYVITVTLASNHTVSFFFSYDMAGILYIISDRRRILSLYTLNIICIT